MICEKCKTEHNGSYGSGRFCGRKCANSRVWGVNDRLTKSLANKGKGNPSFGSLMADPVIKGKILKSRAETQRKKDQLIRDTIPFELWPKRLIRKAVFQENGNNCQECGYNWVDPASG